MVNKCSDFMMQTSTLTFVIVAIASTSVVIGAHVKDFKNKHTVLTSVYDAIKSSVRQDMQKAFNRNEMNHDSRNKRNTGDNKQTYLDHQPSESQTEWVSSIPGNDLVCTRRNDYAPNKQPAVSDHNTALSFAFLGKYGLIMVAALIVPIIFYKVFILPIKILFALKAITILNSLLLGSIFYKNKFWKWPRLNYGSSSASSSSVASSTVSSIAAGNNLELGDENDYVEITRPGEDLKRVLKLVKKRNKNW